MSSKVPFHLPKLLLSISLAVSFWGSVASAQFPGLSELPTAELGRCGGTKTLVGLATCQSRTEKIPQNQSLNLLNVAGQIIRQNYTRLNSNPSEGNCLFRTAQSLQSYPDGTRAYFYYHRDSNFLGMPDGDGHCYAWIYNPSADRLSPLYSLLADALKSQLPGDAAPVFDYLTATNPAAAWKANGLQFQYFGVGALESSDVCLKKVNEWRMNIGATWGVWSQQFQNCFGIASQYTFAQ